MLQGRYKAILVDKDSYLQELSRYIVLNPVRARLCETAADWPWSSYPAVMGKAVAPDTLAVAQTLALFSADRGARPGAFAGDTSKAASAEIAGPIRTRGVGS